MPRIYVKQLLVAADSIDVHGHVNNQEYLRWMEEIAIEHSSAQGWPMERYLNSGASWYVSSHFIEYLRPALLGDEITVYTWVAAMMERNSPRRTLFLRNASRRQILARAETQWTFVDIRRGRSIPIPDEVRSAFEIVESEEEALREAGWLPDAQ
jgi:acyl-CoA thioester hydrolase